GAYFQIRCLEITQRVGVFRVVPAGDASGFRIVGIGVFRGPVIHFDISPASAQHVEVTRSGVKRADQNSSAFEDSYGAEIKAFVTESRAETALKIGFDVHDLTVFRADRSHWGTVGIVLAGVSHFDHSG